MNPNRKSKQKNVKLSQTQIRDILFTGCGGHCPECGRKLQNKNNKYLDSYMTVDHIIPKSKGGKKNIENLRPLCRECNQRRGNQNLNVKAFKDFRGLWITI